ncbi:MAG TPA: 3-oxoacyl-[acyl-carrier-protein] synthase III C-terminal domain-containing protein [Stellaceae bacterium]|nr:3-oxoacyl-[acyl-carrier-protein] synthase III C-terminal domain-containing protein [Stellaceae bacterium]
MRQLPRLAALATAVPPYALDQGVVAARARSLFRDSAQFERLLPVFANSGILRRYSAVPLDWFDAPHGWPDRNRQYISAALGLLESVAGRLLDLGETGLDEIGGIVTVSTTGIATPSLDALLIERMGLPPSVRRLPIFGLGCAGGAIGLARAAELAASIPDRAVLFLVVELCTLAFRSGDDAKSNIVASALFGDGAAGALLRCGADGPAITACGEYTWPHSLDVMGWEVAADGLKAIFSRDIPRLIAGDLRPAAERFLARHGYRLDDIDRFACHPGGPKVIAACEAAFDLPTGALAAEREVLREFGNMSAASVLFVLEQVLAKARAHGDPWRRTLVTALGPGFTAGFAVLDNR